MMRSQISLITYGHISTVVLSTTSRTCINTQLWFTIRIGLFDLCSHYLTYMIMKRELCACKRSWSELHFRWMIDTQFESRRLCFNQKCSPFSWSSRVHIQTTQCPLHWICCVWIPFKRQIHDFSKSIGGSKRVGQGRTRGGRYASCVHAGWLSCYLHKIKNIFRHERKVHLLCPKIC